MSWYFIFFFISGFCSVLYELVWLRLAMAQFGVTTAMVSIVLSVFMAGIGLGAWASGRWPRGRDEGVRVPALRLYALIELLIGVSGIVVPYELACGRNILANFGLASSLAYYVMAGLCVAGTLIPWCGLMGATIPVAMRALGQMFPQEVEHSFSYLYTANVTGAVAGSILPLFLVELLGFRGTLKVGATCNVLIAVSALIVSGGSPKAGPEQAGPSQAEQDGTPGGSRWTLALLFLTGLTSMGMEVVWVREYTPYLGTVVYAFASILAVYLAATLMGSQIYRHWGSGFSLESLLWTLLALAGLLPLVGSSSVIVLSNAPRLLLGIAPFTGLLGFLTPMLVDRYSGGNPGKAGSAYAVNVWGCILGPLLAGFVLLPQTSERWALAALATPWLLIGLRPALPGRTGSGPVPLAARLASYALLPLAAVLIFSGKGYDERFSQREVLRDSTATVIATGSGMNKQLLVNGYGMTTLTPVTKVMAHLSLAFLDRPPQAALDICFGMGTTFRALRSWGIPVTVVELVPSVPRLFGYYHKDGPQILLSPLSHVVIDDGRRYLQRTHEQYDVITIDPPPPVEAAGSSLLYSEEFYAQARSRLRFGGILQQWIPEGDDEVLSSVARALRESFPYVRLFYWQQRRGMLFLASDRPFPNRTAGDLLARMPANAVADLTEWAPLTMESKFTAFVGLSALLSHEGSVDEVIARSPGSPALRDDRPVNEYYALRQAWRRWRRPSADR